MLNLQDFTTPERLRKNAPKEGTGNFDGTFVGGPTPGSFGANKVSLVRYNAFPPVPEADDIQGRFESPDQTRVTFVVISVETSVVGPIVDLATDQGVRVYFYDSNGYAFAYASSGKVTFESMPASGVAKGTLTCVFRKHEGPSFTFKGKFHVSR